MSQSSPPSAIKLPQILILMVALIDSEVLCPETDELKREVDAKRKNRLAKMKIIFFLITIHSFWFFFLTLTWILKNFLKSLEVKIMANKAAIIFVHGMWAVQKAAVL